jgi:hypothetical protein
MRAVLGAALIEDSIGIQSNFPLLFGISAGIKQMLYMAV